jgi:hypothetical protein
MMALAPIVITTSVLTIILQIVLIILVLDTKKKTKFEPKEKPLTQAPEIRDARKPREQENRFSSRRPPLDQRTKPSPAAAPIQNVDPVERSLRDINLRLKNAERDQEKERRRIKDTIATPQQKRNDFSKPRERNEGFRRNDRPRQDYAQQRPVPVREERPINEIKEIKTPPSPSVVAAVVQPAAPPFVAPPLPPQVPVNPIVKPADPVFELEVSNSIDKENLQHGRKVMVKRRVLKAEEEQIEGAGKDVDKTSDTPSRSETLPEQTSSENIPEAKPSIETIASIESKDSEDTKSNEPISFGR